MDIQKAKEIVVEAGKQLVSSGLIARTWGNVSCRIDDKTFVITPSGRAYETLTPDEVVLVNMEDLTYEGDIKPSSEKGIHASCYLLRPDCNFVIHTHQMNASIVSAIGCDINNIEGYSKEIVGDNIPVATYGLSGTGKLRKAVVKAIERTDSKAVIMRHHGAVCLGTDYDDAFKVANEVEKVCEQYVFAKYTEKTGKVAETFSDVYSYVTDLKKRAAASNVTAYDSSRAGNIVTIMNKDGSEKAVIGLAKEQVIRGEKFPSEADMHLAIYKGRQDIKYIIHSDDEATVAASKIVKKKLRPLIDDFAQIAGAKIKCVKWDGSKAGAKDIANALKGKNVVLIKGAGAICTGTKQSDLEAVELVLSKECQTQMGAVFFGAGDVLSPIDCNIMRMIYVTKYSKKASE